MARRYRPRKTEKFQLYRDVEIEAKLIEYVGYLKKTRQFVTVLKNGLRLMWTLSEGNTSVLAELFPGIVQSLKASAPPPPAPDTSNLERKIEQLQQAFLSGGAGSPNGLQMSPALPSTTSGTVEAGGIKSMNIPKIAMPTFDDDEQDTVIIRRDENALADFTANFLASSGVVANMETSEADAGRRMH